MTNLFTCLSNWKQKYLRVLPVKLVAFLALFLIIGSGNVWGADLCKFTTFNGWPTSGYADTKTYTPSTGVTWSFTGIYRSNTTQAYHQIKKNTSTCVITTPTFASNIGTITVTFSAGAGTVTIKSSDGKTTFGSDSYSSSAKAVIDISSESVKQVQICVSENNTATAQMTALQITESAGDASTLIDKMYAKGFASYTTSSYSAAGTDYTAVANSTNATSVTYAMQVFNGSTGQVRGNQSGAANFSCRNTTTKSGYYISSVSLTVSVTGSGTPGLDGSTEGRSLVYFGSSAYDNPNTTAPSGTATTASPSSSGQTTLTWSNSDQSVSYFILYNLKAAGTALSATSTTTLNVTWSKKSACAAPTAVASSSVGNRGATLTVTDANDVNKYDFFCSTSSTPATKTASYSVSGGKAKTINDLNYGTKYYYWARTDCGSGSTSDWFPSSSPSYFTTTCPTVSISAGSITSDGATFTITDGNTATYTSFGSGYGYEIYYSTSSTTPTSGTSATTSTTSTSKSVSGLTAGTPYYYWVRGYGPDAKSNWSGGSSFTPISVSSIAVKTAPTKTTYCAGEYFDPTGLVITATYSNSTTADISYAGNSASFTFSPLTSTALIASNTSVSITYSAKSTTQAITVNTLRTITLDGSGSVTGGTFEADNSSACVGAIITLTPHAASHYSFGSWTVTKAGGGTVDVADNQFTMPDENVTVSASFNEAAYKTVVFMNNREKLFDDGGVASTYDAINKWKQKVYVGESPVIPTRLLAEDACDDESTTFYGWTKNGWPGKIADKATVDALTGANTVYAGALATVAAGDPSEIVYHAVWAEGSAVSDISSTLIAKWDKQSLTAGTAVKAKDASGNTLNDVTLTISNVSLTSSTGVYGYSNNSISGYPVITISGLDFSSYDGGTIVFFARGSQYGDFSATYSTNNGSTYSDLDWEDSAVKAENSYIIPVPNTTTNVKISYGSNSGNFYFGTVRAYGDTDTDYYFTELTSTNTSGWSGADWDGYYLITATQDDKTYALRSDVMEGRYGYSEVTPSDGVIATDDLGEIFKVTYNSSTSKYAIQGVATLDYLTDNAGGVSEKYHLLETSATENDAIAYDDITHATGYYIRWNNGDRFGSYSSGTKPKLYKIFPNLSNFMTTCCASTGLTLEGPTGNIVFITSTAEKKVRSQEAFHISGCGVSGSQTVSFDFGTDALNTKFSCLTETGGSISTEIDGTIDTDFYIYYTPGAGDTSDGIDKSTSLTASVGGTLSANVTLDTKTIIGRHLPAGFVIAAKKDNKWYAMPANMTSTTNPKPVEIAVNDFNNPSVAYTATSNIYGLESPTASNISGGKGQYIRLVMTPLWADDADHEKGHAPLFGKASGSNEIGRSGNSQATSDLPSGGWWWKLVQTNTSITNPQDAKYTIYNHNNTSSLSLRDNAGKPDWGLFASGVEELRLIPASDVVFTEAYIVEWAKYGGVVEVDASTIGATKVKAILNGTQSVKKTLTQTKAGDAKNNTSIYNYTLNFDDEEHVIDFSAAASNGAMLMLEWYNSSDVKVAVSNIIVPKIIADNGVMKTLMSGDVQWETEVHVLPRVTLTANAGDFLSNDVTIKQLEIYQGATVKVTSGTLDVDTLVLRNGWSRAGEKTYDVARLYIATTANLTTEANHTYADWYIDYDQYYPIAVPWEVTLANIRYRYCTVSPTVGYNSNIRLRYYDGAGRAAGTNNGTSWKDYGKTGNTDVPTTLKPSQGYVISAKRPSGKAFSIIRMPLTIPSNSWTALGEQGSVSTTHKDQVAVTAYGNDNTPWYAKGWNYIANPYMGVFNDEDENNGIAGKLLGENGGSVKYATIPDTDFKGYSQEIITEAQLKPSSGFLVQVESNCTLTFSNGNINIPSAPIRKESEQEAISEQEAYIRLSGENGKDQMGLIIGADYTANYEINADLSKMIGEANIVKTWMRYTDMDYAYLAINEQLARELIPVTINLPAPGEYTYSLKNSSTVDQLEGLYLIDYLTGTTTNLIYDDYTFTSTTEGTIGNRFAINAIVGERQVPTEVDISGADKDGTAAVKFIWHDKVYVLHNGVIYDSTGKRVYEINK